tara:strand:+ start:491 stop:604 length:114 start_codon:yes stop_codon:yes gene_type:complete
VVVEVETIARHQLVVQVVQVVVEQVVLEVRVLQEAVQ